MKQGCISVTQEKELTSNSKNLFLISTALHLFNAIEAQHHFQTTNNVLVLLFYGNGNQDEIQIMKYLQYFPYDKLIIFEPKEEKRYHKLNISLIKEINTYTYDKVFMGYFSANLRRFACNFIYKELFLYDDGTYLIALHDELYNITHQTPKLIKKYSEKARKTKFKKLKFLAYDYYRRLYFKFYGYKNDFKEIQLSFFTIFKINKYQNEKIVNHSFEHLQTVFNKNTSPQIKRKNDHTKVVYFLGQPLTKAFEIKASAYLDYMKQIKSFYEKKGFYLVYIPHRSEEPTSLKLLDTLICDAFHVLNLNIPFEIYLLQENTNATHVASFFSSALFTTKKLFPAIQIEAFKPPFNASKRNDIEAIYNIIKKENIKIHPLRAGK